MLGAEPGAALVLVGPRSCGKTRLLRHVLMQHPDKAGLEMPALYIDCRDWRVADSADLTAAILNPTFTWLQSIKELAADVLNTFKASVELLPSGGIGKVVLSAAAKDKQPPTSMLDILRAAFMAVHAATGRRPVLVIDEAQLLIDWLENREADRKALMSFLTQENKSRNHVHVILATSDYSFIEWVRKELGRDHKVQCIGDFPEPDARAFFEDRLHRRAALPALPLPLDDGTWCRVYEVCGGNAAVLKIVALDVEGADDLERALREIWIVSSVSLDTALAGRSGTEYVFDGAAFRTAANLLLASKYGAVDYNVMCAAVGDKDLTAMIKHNVLGLRPQSDWACDVPAEAYGPQSGMVITAYSATDLYYLKQLKDIGYLRPPAPAPALEEPVLSAGDAAQLAGMQKAIEKVEAEIDAGTEAQAALRRERPEGWREDLRALVKKDEQLREEKKQFREKELLLLRLRAPKP